MFYHLLYPLKDLSIFFNLFGYITFRAAGAAIFSLFISLIFGKYFINFLQKKKVGSRIREDTPERHQAKKGTPTMGGLIIIAALVPSTLLWARLDNRYIWLTLFAIVWMGIMGIVDDYLKDIKDDTKGLTPMKKIIGQLILGGIIGAFIYFIPANDQFKGFTEIPFFKNILLYLGGASVLLTAVVVTASSNAINLTDGLDGLAIGLILISAAAFMIISYISGRKDFTSYLQILYLPGSQELSILLAALGGGALGFLWYNAFPAQIFMGDTGALSMGAALGTSAILLKKEFLLLIVGGVFVIETLSVIIQVASYQLFGKRIFKMTPLHHHFELKGWQEPKIVMRFWIIGILFALFAVSTFKLR